LNPNTSIIKSVAMVAFSTLFATLMLVSSMLLAKSAVVGSLSFQPKPILEQLIAEPSGWAILGAAIGAGLAVGLAGVGAGLGMGTASAAALGAITEKPETFGKSILYVVFIEAIAIYGFVISFLLLGYIPTLIGA
jgi:V/A-type H+-transporting ATPase subunit K